MTVSVVNVPMTDSDMRAEILSDGRIKFSFKQDKSTDSSGPAVEFGVGSMKLEITFPGKVVEASSEFLSNGNNLVSLSTTLDKSLDVYAISEPDGAGTSSSSPTVPIIIALVLLLLIGIGLMRNRASTAMLPQIESTDQTEQVNRSWLGE